MPVTLTPIGSVSGGNSITLADAAAVGDRLFLFTPAATFFDVTDTGGHTWTEENQYGYWYCDVTTPLTTSDSVSWALNAGHAGFYTDEPGTGDAQWCGILVRGSGAASWTYDFYDPPGATYPASQSEFGYTTTTPTHDFDIAFSRPEVTFIRLVQEESGITPVVFGQAALPSGPAGFTLTGDESTDVIAASGFFQDRLTVYHRIHTGTGPFTIPALVDPGEPLANYNTALAWFSDFVSAGGLKVSVAYGPTGKRLRASIDGSGALTVDRYDDSVPPGVAATVTVETSGVTGLRLRACGGRWELVYAHADTAKRRQSADQGRTWSVADTIATGYQDVDFLEDAARGLRVVALWDEGAETWYVSVGTLDAGGTAWSYSTPTLLVANARRGGSLNRRRDAPYEFDYRDTSDVLQTVRCRELSRTGAGTWS